MKALGLDLGSVTLGVALSDALGLMAHGIETFKFTKDHYKDAVTYVVDFVAREKISKIVLGLPKHMNNDEGERAKISRRFAAKLELATGIPVILWDERMTTMQVERVLIEGGVRRENRKKHVDKMAATIILQSYLDSVGSGV